MRNKDVRLLAEAYEQVGSKKKLYTVVSVYSDGYVVDDYGELVRIEAINEDTAAMIYTTLHPESMHRFTFKSLETKQEVIPQGWYRFSTDILSVIVAEGVIELNSIREIEEDLSSLVQQNWKARVREVPFKDLDGEDPDVFSGML